MFQNIDLGVLEHAWPTIAMFAWLAWHLNGKFNKIEKDLKELLDKRHLENLDRFTKVEIGLARLGLHNGYGSPKENRDTEDKRRTSEDR